MSTTNHGAPLPGRASVITPAIIAAQKAENERLLADVVRPLSAMTPLERVRYFAGDSPDAPADPAGYILGDAVLAMRETCDAVLEHYTGRVVPGTDLEAVRAAYLRLGALLGYTVTPAP